MENAIRFADASALTDPARFAAAYAAASPQRREKVDRLRAPAAKRLSLAAGALLREMLEEAGVSGADAELAYGEHGKPYLLRRGDVHFSLSHSGARVMCALSQAPVGCDIQAVSARSLKVAERFFSADERRCVFAQADEDARLAMFYRVWVLKESFLKCRGLGRAAPLDAFSVFPEGDRIVLRQQFDCCRYTFSEPDAGAPYVSACCVRET